MVRQKITVKQSIDTRREKTGLAGGWENNDHIIFTVTKVTQAAYTYKKGDIFSEIELEALYNDSPYGGWTIEIK